MMRPPGMGLLCFLAVIGMEQAANDEIENSEAGAL